MLVAVAVWLWGEGRGGYCRGICVEAGAILTWSNRMFMMGTFGAVEEDCWHFPSKPDYFWNLAENQGGASESQRRHTESLLSAQSSAGPVLGGQNKLQLNKTIALHLESHGREFLATETRTELFFFMRYTPEPTWWPFIVCCGRTYSYMLTWCVMTRSSESGSLITWNNG